MPPEADLEWKEWGPDYRKDVSSGPSSSSWLRDAVLKPAIVDLLGDRSHDRVLDVGTGGGWLFDATRIGSGFACDIARPETVRPDVDFRLADVVDLPFEAESFDAIVASIVLCYCANLDKAAAELSRVSAPGGMLVVAQVHPDFYRTGHALEDDRYVIDLDLSKPLTMPIMIGGLAGPFTYHRHSVADYVNALVTAGWGLASMADLFIPRQRYEREHRVGDAIRRSTRVPLFSLLSFRKAV